MISPAEYGSPRSRRTPGGREKGRRATRDERSARASSQADNRLIYGVFADGKPFWAFVAVKTSLYKVFLEDQKHGKIDLGNFEYYGEVIIGNEGKYPPDDIINRVANVYQIDRDRFMKNVRDDVVEAVPKVQAFLAESDAESRRKKRAELAVGPWDKLVASAPADLPGLLHERVSISRRRGTSRKSLAARQRFARSTPRTQ